MLNGPEARKDTGDERRIWLGGRHTFESLVDALVIKFGEDDTIRQLERQLDRLRRRRRP